MSSVVTTGGLVVDGLLVATPTPNNAPTIVGTIAPAFIEGTASEYDLDQHMSDADGDALTASVGGALPSGITLRNNPDDNALVYDGVGADTTSAGHTLTADDGIDTSSPSAAFSIVITDVPAANVIVRKDGSGNYTTPSAAVAAASPGDIIELQAPTAGGSETWIDQIKPTVSGTSGNEITVRSRRGDNVRLYASSGVGGTVEMSAVSYWVVRGDPDDRAKFKLGSADLDWQQSDGGRSVTSDGNIHYLNSASHIDVQDCTIYGGSSLGASHLNEINEGCNTNRFLNCVITLGGTNTDPLQTPAAERGDLMHNRGHSTIFENCSFSLGGHDNLVQHGHYTVIRDCVFDADWTSKSTGKPGARCLSMSTSRDDRGASPWGPNLFENSIIKNADESGDTVNQSAMKLTGAGCIVRGNYYWDNRGAVFSSSPGGTIQPNSVQHNRFYHNTCYNNGIWIRVRDVNAETTIHLNHEHKNNIVVELTGDSLEDNDVDIYWDCTSINQQGTPDNWIGAVFEGNRLHATGRSEDIFLRGPNTHDTVADAETDYPLVWITGNVGGATASFVNAAARTKAGFALAGGSPDLAAAEPMTTVTATETSTTISLDDVRWIYDGFDLNYFGENLKTDYIKIVGAGLNPETNGTVYQVAYQGVDAGTGEVTLTSSASVTSGDEVWLVSQDGSTVWNNRGAGQ